MADAPEKDIAKDGLLAIAPRDTEGRPTLGGIPLYKKLGQGGMGAVYLGKHPRLGVEVAVKILPFHLADADPNAIEYFMREANVAARLNHPSLVRIFDVNVDGDPKAGSAIWYLVMEFVSGLTAGRLIKDRMKSGQGPLSEADALDILLTVSDGLAAAHEQGFVHRDIKPENVIIPRGPGGEPQLRKAKLMDLGLAKAHSEELSMGPTGTNVAMGTPGYMAPEQAENAKGAGPPADVFAMGATLYSLLTGAAPFTGTTVLHVLKKTSDEAHVSIRKVNPNISRPTEILIDTCLAKRPEARYAAAGVLREALKACRQSIGGEVPTDVTLASLQNLASIGSNDATIRAESPSLAPSTPARTVATAVPETAAAPPKPGAPPAPRRRSMAPVLIALVLLVAAGVGGFLVFKGGGKKEDDKKEGAPPVAGGSAFDSTLREAEAAMADEDYGKAETLYAKARQINPKSEAASDGEARARRLKEEESSATTAVGDATAMANDKDYANAWKRIRSAIEAHPQAVAPRMWAAKLALDHGPYSWLSMAINDADVAIRYSGPKRKQAATQVRDQLVAKQKKEGEKAGGALTDIQAALDKGDWDGAERLLDRANPADRETFARAVDHGRKWKSAVDRARQAEASRNWGDALAAYQEALGFRADSETESALRRVELQVRDQYRTECEQAADDIRAGRFDDARRRIAAAAQLLPSAPRHNALKDELNYTQNLSDAKRFQREGKNGEALASATKALALRKDSAEARGLVDQLQKEGPLSQAKAALAAGDRAAAARHARQAADRNAPAEDLKALEAELWADLFVEKAVAASKGPIDELKLASDGRVVGLGAGYGSFAAWAGADLKLLIPPASGAKPIHAALVEKDGLRVVGLTGMPSLDGPEMQPVAVWENGRPRPLQIETSGLKLAVTATRIASFDGPLVLRIRVTAGDDKSGPDVYTLDVLDTEKSAAGNPIPCRAQAHLVIAVAPVGNLFATGGGTYRTWKSEGSKSVVDERKDDTSVYLWSRDTFDKQPVDLGEAVGDGALLAFTPDGSKLLVATAARKLFVIDTASRRVDRSIPLPETVTSLSASGSQAALAGHRRVLLVLFGEGRVSAASNLPAARSVLHSADGASLFVGGEDGLLRRYAYEPLAK